MLGNIPKANEDWSYANVLRNIRRMLEAGSAKAANEKAYEISPESRAALRRGDIQRATGQYEAPEGLSGTNYTEGED